MSRKLLCSIGCALSLTAAIAAFVVNRYVKSACTATNAAGQRVIIGTELNAAGQRYKRDNPSEDNDAILQSLGRYGPETAWTTASIARCRTLLEVSVVLWPAALVLALILGGVAVFSRSRAPAVQRKPGQVFVSYNHDDAAVASKLCRVLKDEGIPVLIDSESMAPGERIQEFIARSIAQSDVVVSLVSSRSLLSAWVAMETISSLQRNQWVEGKRFVACYLDEDFLAPEFRLNCTRQIDERLRRIEELLPDYATRRIDTVDLNEEKSRLYELRNGLGQILATLKGSLCLDLREPGFNESTKRLVASIRGKERRG